MSFNLFLGCVIQARLPFIEKSSRKVFEKLGVDLITMENTSCCPDPTGIPAVDHETWVSLGARNLSLAEKGNSEILSFCSGCVETLKMVNHILEDPHKLEEVNHRLEKVGRKYNGNVTIKHGGQLLYEQLEDVKQAITKPLTGLKVAIHYGCHYLRPAEIIQWDDPFEPHTLDTLVTALGAESIQYSAKMECCGYPLFKTDEDLSLQILHAKLQSLQDEGANCIMVVCPSCYIQFEFQQRAVNKKFGTDFNFPVFYFTELVAIAFGFSPDELGFKFHRIKPKKLLDSLSQTETPME
jgi:heterodisulfide reductase subunit B